MWHRIINTHLLIHTRLLLMRDRIAPAVYCNINMLTYYCVAVGWQHFEIALKTTFFERFMRFIYGLIGRRTSYRQPLLLLQ